MRSRTGAAWGFAIAVSVGGCDDGPTAPKNPYDHGVPLYNASWSPCVSHTLKSPECLLFDLAEISDPVYTQTSSSYTTTVDGFDKGTRSGDMLQVYYTTQYLNNPPVSGSPADWSTRYPVVTDNTVIVSAVAAGGNFKFTGTPYRPTLVAAEFNRPAQSTCAPYSTGVYRCTGTVSAVVHAYDIAWYKDGLLQSAITGPSGESARLTGFSTPRRTGTLGDHHDPAVVDFQTSYYFVNEDVLQDHYLEFRFQLWRGSTHENADTVFLRVPLSSVVVPDLNLSGSPFKILTSGDTVRFAAYTVPDGHIQPLGWSWIPDTVPGQTAPCPEGTIGCLQRVYESGSMKLVAKLNGWHVDSAQVRVTLDECPVKGGIPKALCRKWVDGINRLLALKNDESCRRRGETAYLRMIQGGVLYNPIQRSRDDVAYTLRSGSVFRDTVYIQPRAGRADMTVREISGTIAHEEMHVFDEAVHVDSASAANPDSIYNYGDRCRNAS